jgi:DNA-binding Lrp family transcriptional regulator
MLDTVDRTIINGLQGGLPLTERPFADAAGMLGLEEDVLINRIKHLLERGILSRFGPMYNADRMGGAFCLCAMSVPDAEFDRVAECVNARPEVAHNYERAHALNMWFVLATDTPRLIEAVISAIEKDTGHAVLAFPKLEEYFIGLRVEA